MRLFCFWLSGFHQPHRISFRVGEKGKRHHSRDCRRQNLAAEAFCFLEGGFCVRHFDVHRDVSRLVTLRGADSTADASLLLWDKSVVDRVVALDLLVESREAGL